MLLLTLAVLTLLASSDALANADAEPPPTIAATAPTTSYTGEQSIHLDPLYGENITIFCTASNYSNLALESQFGQLQAVQLNFTTIHVSVKPDVGKHIYNCIDRKTGYNQTLTITVYPAVIVTTPGVRQKRLEDKTQFFVPFGQNYDVSCSGNEVQALKMLEVYYDFDEVLVTEIEDIVVVNTTTITKSIKYVKYDYSIGDFSCEQHGIRHVFEVLMDYIPEAGDFQCVLFLTDKLECTWSSMTKMNTMMIFNEGRLLCTEWARRIDDNKCEIPWNDELENTYRTREELHIDLQTCNQVYCNNQTFLIPIKPITKIDPVYSLQITVDNGTESGTVVNWQHRKSLCAKGCEYKVEYRQMDMQWSRVNLTSLTCYDAEGIKCKLNLPLPCRAHYEVSVYMRPLVASKDRFWSQSASIVYVPTPSAGDDDLCTEFRG